MTTKLCKECGLPFEPASSRQSFCKRDHYRPCPVCKKLVLVKCLSDRPRCCSSECAVKLRSATCIAKYGCKDGGNSEAAKAKRKQTNLARYGVENPAMRKDIMDKQRQTIKAKYGVDNISQLESNKDKIRQTWADKSQSELNAISQKRKETCVEHFGVDNPTKCEDVKHKIKNTLMTKYGVDCSLLIPKAKAATKVTMMQRYGVLNPGQSEEIRKRAQLTSICKYGVPRYSMTPEFKARYKITCQERYGVDNPMQCRQFQEAAKQTNLERYGVPAAFLTEDSLNKCRQAMLSSENFRISKLNRNFSELLSAAGISNELEFRIENRWYDMLIPDTNTVIELNPTYTHSSEGNDYNAGLDRYYHRDKTQLAVNHGFRCINVWDWDDLGKIVGLVSRPNNRYYARDLKCDLISEETANVFLETYHIQGHVNHQEVCIGLIQGEELISLMTFGRPRYNRNVQWELYRYATQFDATVVGGASKLFSHFIKLVNPVSIVSYCDLSKFTGEIYTTLGFKLKHKSSPTRVWSKGKRYVTDNLLRQRGFDQLFGTNYGKGTSNESLMVENGWRSVYDCGQATYIYLTKSDLQS